MKSLTSLWVGTLLLTGCAGGSAPAEPAQAPTTQADVAGPTETPTATPTIMKPGRYTFENATGAKGIMQIPGKPDAEIERLRALAQGAPKVTYLTVKVDNRQGTEGVNMYGVSIFTPAGEELQYKNVDDYINSIRPGDAPAEIYNQFIEAGNKHMAMANPKGVKDFVLSGPAVPAEIAGISVYPAGGFDPVEAVPAP